MQSHGIPLERLASILQRLESEAMAQIRRQLCAEDEDEECTKQPEELPDNQAPTDPAGSGFLEYLSTHPATRERIERIRSAAQAQ